MAKSPEEVVTFCVTRPNAPVPTWKDIADLRSLRAET
jgi:hypothetical protein